MQKLIGVKFKENGKIYYFMNKFLEIHCSDKVIVKTDKGLQLATVVEIKEENTKATNEFSFVIRKAVEKDIKIYIKNLADSEKVKDRARSISTKLGLIMNITMAEYSFDRKLITIYFLADSRVDFRELVKELASCYKARIELRQIGARDKAKEISGIGMCGRKCCCSDFLNELDVVSINMAKNQNLSLNPAKINGICGRLMCCLKYEDEIYTCNRVDMPNLGDLVDTEKGEGYVIFIDIPRRRFIVNVPKEGKVEISLLSNCDNCEKSNK